jgi:hypothetical protein
MWTTIDMNFLTEYNPNKKSELFSSHDQKLLQIQFH